MRQSNCGGSLSNNLLSVQEFNKHDKDPSKYIKHWKGVKPKTGAPYSCDIGYERFLGPEVWFSTSFHLALLDQVVTFLQWRFLSSVLNLVRQCDLSNM